MHKRGLWIVLLVGAAIFVSCEAHAQNPGGIVGCYVAKPALTYSATGGPERGDTSWAYAQLSANGKARRPLLRSDHDGMSSWRAEGDSLHVTFHDGLVGWRLRLARVPQGWSGLATYLSDAIVVGQPPYEHQITLTRRSCARSESTLGRKKTGLKKLRTQD
jgi:hypothetical protein